jgi:hypothetical protein
VRGASVAATVHTARCFCALLLAVRLTIISVMRDTLAGLKHTLAALWHTLTIVSNQLVSMPSPRNSKTRSECAWQALLVTWCIKRAVREPFKALLVTWCRRRRQCALGRAGLSLTAAPAPAHTGAARHLAQACVAPPIRLHLAQLRCAPAHLPRGCKWVRVTGRVRLRVTAARMRERSRRGCGEARTAGCGGHAPRWLARVHPWPFHACPLRWSSPSPAAPSCSELLGSPATRALAVGTRLLGASPATRHMQPRRPTSAVSPPRLMPMRLLSASLAAAAISAACAALRSWGHAHAGRNATAGRNGQAKRKSREAGVNTAAARQSGMKAP